MIINFQKKTPLKYRFLEIVYLALIKTFPNSENFKIARKKNQSNAIKHFMSLHPPGSEAGKVIQIDRIENLSKKDFYRNYVNKGIPVIFKSQIKNWSCSKNWSFESFSQKYGEDEYHIVTPDGFLCEEELKNYNIEGDSAGKFKFKDILKNILDGKILYLRLFPLLENHPELLDDINTKWLKNMSRSVLGAIYHTFLGAKGRKTHVHNGSSSFFYMMVKGSKKWKFWDTSYFPLLNMPSDSVGYFFSDISREDENFSKNPHYKFIDRYECILEEGDILYCPVWMFHYAENLDLSFGVRYGVFDPIDMYRSSFGFTFIKIFFSEFLTLFWHSKTGKSHERDSNRSVPKIIKR